MHSDGKAKRVRGRFGQASRWSKTAIRKAKRDNPHLVIDYCRTPQPVDATITTQPRLPPFYEQWYLVDAGPEYEPVSADFTGQICFREHGRRDDSRILRLNGVSLRAKFDFGEDVLGGEFTSTCIINWRRKTDGAMGRTPSHSCTARIVGSNPPKTAIKQALNDLALKVIAYKESRFRQFDQDGMPLFGPPNGFGIMQLDNPRPTSRQLWDWRANVAAGVSLWSAKKREVAQHFTNLYKKYPNAPKLTPEQLKAAQYQHYNTGGNASWYWEWRDDDQVWAKIPNNGYADDCLRIEDLVMADNPPTDWS